MLAHIREGKIQYRRGDTKKVVPSGIRFVERERDTKSGDDGEETLISADVCVLIPSRSCIPPSRAQTSARR